ncbi:MAG: zinc ribbon domain-containing protein [Chloroflexi bacterium]|nr:MAG: zinc ribbon domain-containing protein [Chloroflexota bacterium]MBL1193003.1 zinc ribbon domain-containing protein [Chloroflexota bacterium]NOH10296.1 zinc ribbon domain-containing protein [Chloroflexota bacterium]
MPVYPYTCQDCKKGFAVFLNYEEYGKKLVQCKYCGSEHVQRRLGRVRFARSEGSRMASLADPSRLAGLEDDPKAMAKLMRQVGDETGEDMGEEFGEVVGRLEAGQSPHQIEKDLPDLGADGDL